MNIVHHQQLPAGRGLFELRSPRIPEDVPLVWSWWTSRHVGRRWSWQTRLGPLDATVGHYTPDQLAAYLNRMNGAPDASPPSNVQALVGSIDGVDVCYLEVYAVSASPLRDMPGLCPADRGMHLIIGSLSHLGQGLAEVIGNAVAAWQFSNHPDAQHFVVEPSATNDLAIRAALRAGGGHLLDFGEVQLPHKRARVFALARSATKGAPGSSPHPKPHSAALDVASAD